jgi:hypothetical protein
MSTQLSPVREFPVDAAGQAGAFVFGKASPLPLTISRTLVARMWGQVDDGVRLLPRGGAEVGGLLVGPKSREYGLVADEIIPLPIEYKHGPSFRMSNSDLAKMTELIETAQSDPARAVVGFYRSQTRNNETFRESDREICAAIETVHTSFADDFRCHFVLAPVSRAEKLAHVGMRNGTEWDRTRFTVHSSMLPAVPVPPPPATRVKVSAEPPAERLVEARPMVTTEQSFDFPEPRLISTRRPTRTFFAALGIIGGALVISGGALEGYRWMLKSSAPAIANRAPIAQSNAQPSRMGFSADRQGALWKLSWDRGSMAALKPSGALLEIKDGANAQQIHLTPSDLLSGTIFYTPHGGDLSFLLQLELAGATPLEEHIRVLEGPPPSAPDASRKPVRRVRSVRSAESITPSAASDKAATPPSAVPEFAP